MFAGGLGASWFCEGVPSPFWVVLADGGPGQPVEELCFCAQFGLGVALWEACAVS